MTIHHTPMDSAMLLSMLREWTHDAVVAENRTAAESTLPLDGERSRRRFSCFTPDNGEEVQ